jgi:hypothetical protein
MNLLDFNEECLKKSKEDFNFTEVTQEDIDDFNNVLNTSETVRNMWKASANAKTFYKLFPDIKGYFGKQAVELYYASKLNYRVDRVPSYIVYVLQSAISLNKGTPHANKILNSCYHLLTNEVKFTYNGLTLDKILASLISKDVKLLTPAVSKVKDGEVYEVYVKDAGQVAILPKQIGDALSVQDCENLEFKKSVGIVCKDIPIRTLGGKLGVTLDDFDLTDCV